MITVVVELSDELACAMAEFLKRVGYSDYRSLAACDEEAYNMQEAGERLRAALALNGCAPR
jgi:hypothetical protein